MGGPFGSLSIALCGVATSVLVALTNVSTAHRTGFNLFTLSIVFIVPIGACVAGIIATSGYYFSALFFTARPPKYC